MFVIINTQLNIRGTRNQSVPRKRKELMLPPSKKIRRKSIVDALQPPVIAHKKQIQEEKKKILDDRQKQSIFVPFSLSSEKLSHFPL